MTRIILAALGCLAAAAPAAAAPIDDKAAMICTISAAFDCDAVGDCVRTSLRELNAPAFLEISPADLRIAGERPDGTRVDSAIERLNRDGDQLVLQGDEAARGWTVTIATADGRMTVTLADTDYALVGFGACRNGE